MARSSEHTTIDGPAHPATSHAHGRAPETPSSAASTRPHRSAAIQVHSLSLAVRWPAAAPGRRDLLLTLPRPPAAQRYQARQSGAASCPRRVVQLTTTMPAATAQRKDAREEFRLPNIQITKPCSLDRLAAKGWDQMHRLVRFVHGYGARRAPSEDARTIAAGSWVTPINWSRFITAANGRRSAGHLPTCRGRLGTWERSAETGLKRVGAGAPHRDRGSHRRAGNVHRTRRAAPAGSRRADRRPATGGSLGGSVRFRSTCRWAGGPFAAHFRGPPAADRGAVAPDRLYDRSSVTDRSATGGRAREHDSRCRCALAARARRRRRDPARGGCARPAGRGAGWGRRPGKPRCAPHDRYP